jgi:hypothetical protein
MLLAFVMAVLGYGLMLIAMTYIVVRLPADLIHFQGYFFAICIGLAIGEFVFGRFYPHDNSDCKHCN